MRKASRESYPVAGLWIFKNAWRSDFYAPACRKRLKSEAYSTRLKKPRGHERSRDRKIKLADQKARTYSDGASMLFDCNKGRD